MVKSLHEADLSYLDDDERELADALERGELEPSEDFGERKKELQEAAQNSLKRKTVSLHFPERDIGRIKQIARREGVPYQSLMVSIIHRFAEGTLRRNDKKMLK